MYATEFIRNETDKNKFVTAAFLDLSKAFDSINHEILSVKLDNLGFDTSALKLISSFLSDRVQSVVLNDIFSDSLSFARGVPQGTVLVPFFCSISISMICMNKLTTKQS